MVVTDILMPDGDGWSAIAEVRRLYPNTRILAISGGAREMPARAILRIAQRAGALGFLVKPFTRPTFLDAVASVMAHGAIETRRNAALIPQGERNPGIAQT